MRRTKDPSSPLDHVLHDGLGFEQVVACVDIKIGHDAVPRRSVLIQTQFVAGAIGVVPEGRGYAICWDPLPANFLEIVSYSYYLFKKF